MAGNSQQNVVLDSINKMSITGGPQHKAASVISGHEQQRGGVLNPGAAAVASRAPL